MSPRLCRPVGVTLLDRGSNMSLTITANPVPLAADDDGVVRVGGTRVTLDTVIAAYQQGKSAEGIVDQYPSLRLNEVYSVIGYVLSHPEEVVAYLNEQRRISEEVRRENE